MPWEYAQLARFHIYESRGVITFASGEARPFEGEEEFWAALKELGADNWEMVSTATYGSETERELIWFKRQVS